MKADGSGDSSEQAQEKSESEAAEQKQTSDEGVQGQSGPRQPVGDGVANRRTDTEQAELGNLLDYARMAFDRAYGHIVALGERFNLIAATSSVLMVALLTVVLLSDIFHRSSEKEAVVTAIAKLSMAGMSCLVLSILFCLVSVFRSVGPDRSEADQSRDFFPLTHDMRSDRHLIDEVIRYMGPATRDCVIGSMEGVTTAAATKARTMA